MEHFDRSAHLRGKVPNGRAWLHGLCLIAGACGAIAGAAALCGAFSRHLDLLTHLLPAWLILGLGGSAAAAALKPSPARARHGLVPAGLALVSLACAIGLIAPDRWAPTRRAIAPGPKQSLRLIQLNAWKHNKDLPQTADWILAQRPDVVVLEEAFAQNLPLVRRLRKRLPYRVSCTGRDPCSTTILSRMEPIASGGLKDRESTTPLAGAWATYQSSAGRFSVLAVQLPWPLPVHAQQARVRLLVDAAHRLEADDLIIAGDFNTTSWSYSLRRLDRELGARRVTRGVPTWPARGFLWTRRSIAFMPIDQVYVGGRWDLVSLRRGDRVGSDHYPLVIDLQRGLSRSGS